MKFNVEITINIPYPKKYIYTVEARNIEYAIKYALKDFKNDKRKNHNKKHIDRMILKTYKI